MESSCSGVVLHEILEMLFHFIQMSLKFTRTELLRLLPQTQLCRWSEMES